MLRGSCCGRGVLALIAVDTVATTVAETRRTVASLTVSLFVIVRRAASLISTCLQASPGGCDSVAAYELHRRRMRTFVL